MVQNDRVEEAYRLCQKAYYFYPKQQVKTLLFSILIVLIEENKFDNVVDIDLLAQLSRFDNVTVEAVSGIFNNILINKLQYIDKTDFCDSIHARLIPQITDNEKRNETDFVFNILMANHFHLKPELDKYIDGALKIKSNHKAAIDIFSYRLNYKLTIINDYNTLLDTLPYFEKTYDYEFVKPIIEEYRLRAYLQLARKYFVNKSYKSFEKYLKLFEDNCPVPNQYPHLQKNIESTYYTVAISYFDKNQISKAKDYINRGLKFQPDSEILKKVFD